MQGRVEQLQLAAGASGNAAPTAVVPDRRGMATWKLPALLLLGLGGLAAAWTLRPQPKPANASVAAQVAVAPAVVVVDSTPPPTPVVTDTVSPSIAASAAPTDVPAAEPKPVLMPADEQVKRTVEAWLEDWAARDMMAYLDHYSESFAPADGVSRRDWIASRYRNVGGRPSIEVRIHDLKIETLSNDRARVSFLQDYASGSYRESAQPKTLDLVLEADDRWRIRGEWQGKPPPATETGKS